ncbi:MAG: cation transporter [Magnetococcales bacterium]|nr:cation transporter [Magnetococcales bacterium]
MAETHDRFIACTIPVHAEPAVQAKHCQGCATTAARLDFFMTVAISLFSAVMGSLSGSIGLHAMALLAFGDVLVKGGNWISIRISRKPPTSRFPYGYGKVLFLSSFIMGGVLFSGAVAFFLHNIRHLNDGLVEKPSFLAIFAALTLTIVGEMMYRKLSCVARTNNNPALKAAALDNRMDALSASMVLIGAVLAWLGWLFADHLAALLVSLLVLRVGFKIVVESVEGLLDIGLAAPVQNRVEEICVFTHGVRAVVWVRGRRLGDYYELDLGVEVDGGLSVETTHQIRHAITRQLTDEIDHIARVQITFTPHRKNDPPA